MKHSFQFFIFLAVLSFFLAGCEQIQLKKAEDKTVPENLPISASQDAEPSGESAEKTIEIQTTEAAVCEYNSECGQGLSCINKKCKSLVSLYNSDCEKKCNVAGVKIKTSDGENYDLSPGQGSYTAAGAIEWKIMKIPNYCQEEDPLVAVNIIKKTTGKIVGEQVLTLRIGDTSEEITHPTVKSVKFTATLADVTETCY